MQIALISDWFAPRKGGIESHLSGLGRALAAAGHGVTALTAQPQATATDLAITLAPLALRHIPLLDLALPFGLRAELRRHLAALSPDVVHVHASIIAPACLAGVQAALDLGLPVIITFHSDLRLFAPLLRLMAAWRGRVVFSAVSAPIAAQLDQVSGGAAVVLPNGFDRSFWQAPPQPRAAGEAFHIVSALRLTRKKRPLVLARLADRVAQATGRRVRLTIAGQGQARFHRALLQAGASLTGWLGRDDLRALYHGADLFIQPARFESFGIAALEARAAGLPVIGRAGTGLAEFVTDGADGFLCDTDHAMTQAAIAIARTPDLQQHLSGPRPDLARYDWPQVAARHLAIYADAARTSAMSRTSRNR